MKLSEKINIEECIENSYKNYHAKGVDYICLFRSSGLTIKAYFFDEGSKNNEIVNPHNHRYSFDTRVLAGSISEVKYKIYIPISGPDWSLGDDNYIEDHLDDFIWYKFDWSSPLLNSQEKGKFTFKERVYMMELPCQSYGKYFNSSCYSNKAEHDIHTLKDVKPNTVLLINQYQNQMKKNQPTNLYSRALSFDQNLYGLYEKFKPDDVIKRLNQLDELLK